MLSGGKRPQCTLLFQIARQSHAVLAALSRFVPMPQTRHVLVLLQRVGVGGTRGPPVLGVRGYFDNSVSVLELTTLEEWQPLPVFALPRMNGTLVVYANGTTLIDVEAVWLYVLGSSSGSSPSATRAKR